MPFKQLLLSIALLLVMLTATAYAQRRQGPAAPPLKVMPLGGGVYWTSGGAGGNTGFIVGTTGVIVIDAKMTVESAKAMIEEIAKVTPKPVTHVILTHSDPDHVVGLPAFPKAIVVIAHQNCTNDLKERWRRSARPRRPPGPLFVITSQHRSSVRIART